MEGIMKTSGYSENDKEISVKLDPQETEGEGVVCSGCNLAFIVMAIDPKTHLVRAIPLTGTVDYFCPACGKNLKYDIAEMLKAG